MNHVWTVKTWHPEYWQRLQQMCLVPWNFPYQWVPKARVTYEERTDEFTLLADQCIFKNKQKIQAIMRKLTLPATTRAVADRHYKFFKCFQEIPPKWELESEWNFECLNQANELQISDKSPVVQNGRCYHRRKYRFSPCGFRHLRWER